VVDNNRRNYYRVLHVQPDAPLPIIKSSYRALMLSLEMHPDHGGDHWNAAVINEAYEVLSDPQLRDEYDRGNAPPSPASRRGQADPQGQTGPPSQADARPPGSDPIEPDAALRCVFCGARTARLGYADRCPRCESPLAAPEKIESGGAGDRLTDRIPLRASLEYFDTWPQRRPHRGQLADLTPNGIRLTGDHRVEEHRILKIESDLISATARVVYCRTRPPWSKRSYSIGADFFTVEFGNPVGTFLSKKA